MAKMQSSKPFTLAKDDADRITKCDERIRKLLGTKGLYGGNSNGGVVILGVGIAEKLIKLAEASTRKN